MILGSLALNVGPVWCLQGFSGHDRSFESGERIVFIYLFGILKK